MLHEEECRRASQCNAFTFGCTTAAVAAVAAAFQCLLIAAKMRWQSKVWHSGMTLRSVEGCQF